ncbi:MAG: hemerythrin domain-containing protein [Myxococcota bacterium]|nr:hemerythrin domain-containing protein [Myxococcota bacterium]
MSSVPEHIDHVLATFHEKEWRLLAELDAALAGNPDKRLTAPWRHLHDTLAAHMTKEEQILFPAMRAKAAGKVGMDFRVPLQVMAHEHEILGTLEIAMRAAARDAGELEEPLLELLDDLGAHAAFEDDTLFPAALALYAAEPAEASPEAPQAAPNRAEPSPAPQRPEPKRAAPKHGPIAGLRARAQGVKSRIKGLLHL